MVTTFGNYGFHNYGNFGDYVNSINYGNCKPGGFNSMMPMVSNSFGMAFPGFSTGGGSSSDSYERTLERQRRQEEVEFQRIKQEYDAKEAQREQEEQIEEMQKEASDIFPELTAEEEKVLLKYLEKVNKSYNKECSKDICDSILGITATASAVGVISWVGEHSHATELLANGASYVGQGISNITPGCIRTACSSVGNGTTWLAQHTGVSTINNSLNTMGYERVADAAVKMSEKAANATGTFSKVATSMGAKTANFCNGALSKAAKFGPVVEAGKVIYEDWGDLRTAYKAGGKSAVKQTAQTGVKAGAAALGFWAGCKGGAALGASIGSIFGPVGTAVGGFLGGLIGGAVGAWGAKKAAQACVGEDEGERLKRLEMEKAAAEQQIQAETEAEQQQQMEDFMIQNDMLLEAIKYSQSDGEIDEETASVLYKLQGRFPEEFPPPEEQSAQAAA